MEERLYSLKETSLLTGIPEATLKTRLNRGKLTGIKIKVGDKPEWRLPESILASLGDKGKEEDLASIKAEWLESLRLGTLVKLDGKLCKPFSSTSLTNYNSCLGNYFSKLGVQPSVKAISAENLTAVYSKINVDDEMQKCHYGIKSMIHCALVSFSVFLVSKGLKSPEFATDIINLRPSRKYPPRKTVLTEAKFLKILDSFDAIHERKARENAPLARIILCIAVYAGLRSSEIVNLKLLDIDLDSRTILVRLGKGNKTRRIGMTLDLFTELKDWIGNKRPKCPSPYLLVSPDGSHINRAIIATRIAYISKKTGIDITPHGLRRTCATILSKKVNFEAVRTLMGHADPKMTASYIMTDELESAKAINAINFIDPLVNTPEPIKTSIPEPARPHLPFF